MKTKFFLAGALLLAVAPATLVLSGCGGGSSSVPELRFARQSNVEFPDSPEVRGVLTVNFVDAAPNANARASGTLQLFTTPVDPAATPTATPRPFPDPPPGAGTTKFLSVVPADATYLLIGNVVPGDGVNSDLALDLRGSYEGSPGFTLRGNFVNDAQITLEAQFNRGTSTLRGRIINVNKAILPTRPGTTAGATTTGATTTGATTTGATTTGATTTGATTTGATTTGATTAGLTMAGGTTAGGTSAGATTGSTSAGATTGSTTASTTGGSTAGGTTVGLPPSTT